MYVTFGLCLGYLGIYLGYVGFMCGLCPIYGWAMFGLFMSNVLVYVFVILGLCMGLLLDYVPAMSWVMFLGYWWVHDGLCLGYVWVMFDHVWVMIGSCFGYVWIQFGLCLVNVWEIVGFCFGLRLFGYVRVMFW